MLRLRAFHLTSEKIVKVQLHPTHPWLVTANASDNVIVWNWEHRQVSTRLLYCFLFFIMKFSALPDHKSQHEKLYTDIRTDINRVEFGSQ